LGAAIICGAGQPGRRPGGRGNKSPRLPGGAPGSRYVYYLTMGAGLAVSLLVILATLPLLGRITGLENVRFE